MPDESRFIAEDPLGNRVYMAETAGIAAFPKEVDALLLLVGEFMGWDGDISHVFVTDMSSLSDFCLEDEEVQKLSGLLGIPVKHEDLLMDIAKQMRAKGDA